jgi:hypothetical protein
MASSKKQYGAIRFSNFRRFDEPKRNDLIDRRQQAGVYEAAFAQPVKTDKDGSRTWSFR